VLEEGKRLEGEEELGGLVVDGISGPGSKDGCSATICATCIAIPPRRANSMEGMGPFGQLMRSFWWSLSSLARKWSVRVERAARRISGRPLRDPCNFCGVVAWGHSEHGISCHEGWICDRCLEQYAARLAANAPTLADATCSFCRIRRGATAPMLGGRGALLLCAVCVAEYEPLP